MGISAARVRVCCMHNCVRKGLNTQQIEKMAGKGGFLRYPPGKKEEGKDYTYKEGSPRDGETTQKLRTHTAFEEIRVQFPAPYWAAYKCLEPSPRTTYAFGLFGHLYSSTHIHTQT